jgi:hypothetical protein
MRNRHIGVLAALGIAASVLAVAPGPAGAAPTGGPARIEVLSSPPDLVSGDAARIRIELPGNVRARRAFVHVDGEDVTDDFWIPDDAPGEMEGVIDGLPLGESTIHVGANKHGRGAGFATLTITNHPITGPMFSGPHQEPFLCSTAGDRAGAELGPAIDADCSVETVVSFKYRSTAGGWRDYDPEAPRPADLATTTTIDGETVDYIVRWERGTINRFIYSIAVLSPEDQRVEAPDLSAWNDRLVYYFQGGVGIGHYQGDPSGSRMLWDDGLSRGYAVAYSTGTKTGEHYNLELGGETAIMVKDRFVTEYGDPDYTIGVGGSGGGIQQYVYAQNHPGLIDAGVPQYSYPDMITQAIHIGDCELLERWIDMELLVGGQTKWADWDHRQWLIGLNASDDVTNPVAPVMPPGYPAGASECTNAWRGLSPLVFNPHYGTAPGVTPEQQVGTEWTHFADLVNIYGIGEDGYANSNWDNVGVQYGLQALVDGNISADEFIRLNAQAGGWKNQPDMVQEGCPILGALCALVDPTVVPPVPGIYPQQIDPWSWRNQTYVPGMTEPAPRTAADEGAITAAYESGMVNRGDIEIPMIDWRHYLEDELDMHNSRQSFVTRQRLLDHDGDASNQVIWFTDARPDGPEFDQTMMAFAVLDEWMANIEAHPDAGVAGNKPAAAVDSCFDTDGTLRYAGEDAWDGILDDRPDGPCTADFPIYSTSRIVAGGPFTGDVFKCHLQSIDEAVAAGLYGDVEFDAVQRGQLELVFPDGVCDYERGDAGRPADLD